MSASLIGLLGGINRSAEENREDVRRREAEQEKFERNELSRIAGDESYQPDVRERAASALWELAANPNKRPKGSFTERLMGVNRIEAHPAVQNVFRWMQSPELKGGLPYGLVQTRPNPPASAVTERPTSAAMPTTPAGQPGGGPPSVASLGSPSGQGGPSFMGATPRPSSPSFTGPATRPSPMDEVSFQEQETPPGPPDLGVSGALPIDESTGAPPQTSTPFLQTKRRLLRTPAEIAIEAARAKSQGDLEGEIAAYSTIMPREQVIEMLKAERMNRYGSATPFQQIFGEAQDPSGKWYQTAAVFNRRTGAYEDLQGKPLPTFRARQTTGSVSVGADKEAAAMRLLDGRRYSDPSVTPEERARVDEFVMQQSAQTVWRDTFARLQAAATGPLSRESVAANENTLRDDYERLGADFRTMEGQYQMMFTGLNRFGADPVGAVDSIRSGFARMVDPQSVVREGEYNRQGLGLSAFDRMVGLKQKWIDGGGDIPEPILREMVETARQFTRAARDRNEVIRKRYNDTATRRGLDPRNITGTSDTTAEAPTGPPAVPQATPAPAIPGVTAPASPAAPAASTAPPAVMNVAPPPSVAPPPTAAVPGGLPTGTVQPAPPAIQLSPTDLESGRAPFTPPAAAPPTTTSATTSATGTPEAQIRAAATQVGLDPNLALAVARQESSLNPRAVGDGGKAIGVFQLHEGAAKDVGVTDRSNPAENIRGGVTYLKSLVDRYQGDLTKALQAYNGGQGNVDRGTVSAAAQAYAERVLASMGAPQAGGARPYQGEPPRRTPDGRILGRVNGKTVTLTKTPAGGYTY